MALYCCDCGKAIDREKERYVALQEFPGDIRFAHVVCHQPPVLQEEKVARPGPRLADKPEPKTQAGAVDEVNIDTNTRNKAA